jgi:hypothetical protein
MRQHNPIVVVFIRRGAALWLSARLFVGLVMYASGASALDLPFSVRVALIALTVVLGFIHSMRHHERSSSSAFGIRPTMSRRV